MKKIIQRKRSRLIGIVWAFMLLIPGMLSAQALSGTYTIGTGGTYTTIANAVSDLSTKGVSGPVTFNIIAGTYDEQFTLDVITGSSTTNTVTFQSQGGVASGVQIYHTAAGTADNYVIKINGASNLSFKNLTLSATGTSYGKVIDITAQSSNISVLNDSLTSGSGISSSTNGGLIMANNVKLSDITINNNVFYGGSYGVRFIGVYNDVSTNFSITNNRFANLYTGIQLQYVNTATVSNNTASVTSGYAIYLNNAGGVVRVTKNILTSNNANGLYLTNISSGTPPTGTHGLIANNMIHITGSQNGIYVTSSTYQDIVYNTVNVTGSGTSSKAFYSTSGSNYLIEDNIFSNDAGGYAYYAGTPSAISISDFNNLYSTGNYLAYWNGNLRDLAALQTASSKEVHSVSVY
ncbi:MAG TPA: right-handed parallel beta-helix repeat-containing protein, partial [Balneolales bacterium]|nr:right-handed parallel beta-helix repeat-containing protein [Balneolales bacterium]